MLLTPGPVSLPPSVQKELAQPLIHHRKPAFEALFQELQGLLRAAFGGLDREVLVMTSSGSGALQAAASNLLGRGDHVLALVGGKFGGRMADYAEAQGAVLERVLAAPDQELPLEKLLSKITGDTKALLLTATETTTGARLDLETLLQHCLAFDDLLVIVDGIAWLGAEELPTNYARIDVMLGASQKAFAAPPGLSLAQLSERAHSRLRPKQDYFDFQTLAKAQAQGGPAYTMPSSLVAALKAGLEWLAAQGASPANYHRQRAESFRNAARAFGMEFLPLNMANALTVIRTPEGVDANLVRDRLEQEAGFEVAGGQNAWQRKILRVGHMGAFDDAHWPKVAAAIGAILVDS